MAVGLKIVNGDFVINPSGVVETISGPNKCSRDFLKMTSTRKEYYGNETSFERYNPLYGTELDNFGLYRNLSKEAARDMVIMKLNEAIGNYITIQESRSNLDLGEIISYVDFDVVYDASDLRKMQISIKLGNAQSGELDLGTFVQELG